MSDGRSASLTAPNGQAQQALLDDALAIASIDPMDLAQMEAHGTGTALGDPIEASSLVASVFAHRASATPIPPSLQRPSPHAHSSYVARERRGCP